MGIIKPDYHLKSQHDLPSFRSRVEGPVGGRKLSADLNLTSLIDVFSVIILFLVSTFSATGEIFIANKDIKLPSAKYGFMFQRSPIVTVDETGVTLEGIGVGSNIDIEEKIEDRDWSLPVMKQRLRSYKEFFESAAAGVPFPGRVILQADQDLSFLYLKRVMYTLNSEGYTNIDLIVSGEAVFRPDSDSL